MFLNDAHHLNFQMTLHGENKGYVMLYFFWFLGNIGTVNILCIIGQIIMNSSELVYEGVSTIPWYRKDFSIQCRKLILMLMVKSQRPCMLACLGLVYQLKLGHSGN